jgi:hypothetical protein
MTMTTARKMKSLKVTKNTKFGHGLDGVGAEAENQDVDLRNMPNFFC